MGAKKLTVLAFTLAVFVYIVSAKTIKNQDVSLKKSSSIQPGNEHKHTTNKVEQIVYNSRKTLEKKQRRKGKKSKRDAYGNYRRYWSSKSSNTDYGAYSNNMPLYLVYNRKVGAYYPYYKYPKEYIRRNGGARGSRKVRRL